tara:strand:- start:252 stop:779 length:528 start_codon:yes stop_codon:yes gene_type:complete
MATTSTSDLAAWVGLWHSPDPDYLDSDGYYISPEFDVATASGSFSSGEIGAGFESVVEELFGNTIFTHYTYSEEVDEPTVTWTSSTTETAAYTYDSAEELALQEKWGGSADDAGETIEDYISMVAAAVTTTAVNAEYTFKKVKYDDLDYDNLSSFEEDEAEQSVSVATTFVSGAY